MNLLKLLHDVEYLGNASSIEIQSITHDSRKVKEGALFIALKGEVSDGYNYINDAIKNGASAILANSRKVVVDENIPVLNVANVRKSMSKIASNFFQNPSKKMNLIGVTGTNGKTSVCYLINHIFNDNNLSSGSIGTLGYINSSNIISTGFTTPESIDLHQILDTAVNGGIENIVMEVSSHSIDMHRVDDIHLNIGVFTNLTPEHLDFHGSMENYLKSKQKMFTRLGGNQFSIVNQDDSFCQEIISKTNSKKITYGLSNADIYPVKYHFIKGELLADISVFGKRINIVTPLIGKYNLYNILASIGASFISGLALEQIVSSLNKKIAIPGRLEVVYNKNQKMIILDYAHTPDAFENVLQTISSLGPKKIITIFGCGGDRDTQKRAPMAQIAEKYSSKIIITSDNPRTERLDKIINDIELGFNDKKHIVIKDRTEALLYGIKDMDCGSILMVLGKGVENYQEINGEKIPYNEKEIILGAIYED